MAIVRRHSPNRSCRGALAVFRYLPFYNRLDESDHARVVDAVLEFRA